MKKKHEEELQEKDVYYSCRIKKLMPKEFWNEKLMECSKNNPKYALYISMRCAHVMSADETSNEKMLD